MDIEIKVGDKVIRADGLSGEVVKIVQSEYGKYRLFYYAKMENGGTDTIVDDEDGNFSRFYLIGKTIFGNKLALSELDKQIANTHAQIEELKAKEAQLRKQRWRLETQMNPEITKQAVNIAPDEYTIKPSNSAVTGAKEAVTDGKEIKTTTEDK